MSAGLETFGLHIAYGGNVAVQDATLSAPLGTITGLIGPNGAGKTTTFNACNGLLKPSSGRVQLFGQDVTRRGPQTRARMGLGRTFQQVQVCANLTVRENVALGAEVRLVGRNPFRQLAGGRGQQREVRLRTEAALRGCGLEALADAPASTLGTGRHRLLELARVFAGGYRMLLLDEPSSGLEEEETAAFGRILRTAVADRGIGILVVEHDMSLVMSVCDYIYVLDFGTMIYAGTPAETQASEVVRKAYLGEVEAEVTP